MNEYGGYIELDQYRLPMLHSGAMALNCARNALLYLIKARKIKKFRMPFFLCEDVFALCKKNDIVVRYYNIDETFYPQNIFLENDEWLYVVNYYGQLNNQQLQHLKDKYERVIIDNAQAYFQKPLNEVDTIYTCRKFFGVSDGAFLYTNCYLEEKLPRDESFERMHFLLGRFERPASDFYREYIENNGLFLNEPIKWMSKLTENLLHGIDYEFVRRRRTDNFSFLHKFFSGINWLSISVPDGAFMYPLYIRDAMQIREKLQLEKVYIPILWPNVLEFCKKDTLEYKLANNILPLPVDQRYNLKDMEIIADKIIRYLR